MKLFSITLAGSLLLAIVSVASVSDSQSPHAVRNNSLVPLEITQQLAEAEEGDGAVLTQVLIASWTSAATSSASSTETNNIDSKIPTPQTEVVRSSKRAPTKTATNGAAAKITPAPKTKTVTSSTLPSQSGYSLTEVRKQIHSRSNTARANNNLASLSLDSTLASIAQKRSEDMITKNYFSHTSPSGCDLICRFEGLGYSAYGENLAEYYEFDTMTEPQLVATFITMWLKSPSHRRNLLSSDFSHEGVGVAIKGNRIVVTVTFAKI